MREEERGDERFKQVETLIGGDTWHVAICQSQARASHAQTRRVCSRLTQRELFLEKGGTRGAL